MGTAEPLESIWALSWGHKGTAELGKGRQDRCRERGCELLCGDSGGLLGREGPSPAPRPRKDLWEQPELLLSSHNLRQRSPASSQITGVSILRAGETMEQALTAVCKDIRLGKILIQTNHDTGEPEVSSAAAPAQSPGSAALGDLTSFPSAPLPAAAQGDQRGLRHPHGQHRVHGSRGHDGSARPAGEGPGSGAGGAQPARPWPGSHGSVPQDHDVQEDRIFLLSLLMAEMGVHSVAYAFPRVRIITTAVDKRINEEFHIIPGIGEGGGGAGRGQPPALQPPALQPLAVPRGPALPCPHSLCPHLL